MDELGLVHASLKLFLRLKKFMCWEFLCVTTLYSEIDKIEYGKIWKVQGFHYLITWIILSMVLVAEGS